MGGKECSLLHQVHTEGALNGVQLLTLPSRGCCPWSSSWHSSHRTQSISAETHRLHVTSQWRYLHGITPKDTSSWWSPSACPSP